MAIIRQDGLVQTDDGQIIGPSDPVTAGKLCELLALLCDRQISAIAARLIPLRILGRSGAGSRLSATPGGGGGGAACLDNAKNTLYVSPVWNACLNPDTPGGAYWTTIQGAIDEAAAHLPTQFDRWNIVVGTGLYAESLTLFPNIDIGAVLSAQPFGALVAGAVTYSPTGAGDDLVALSGLFIPTGITHDTTGKTGGASTFALFHCATGPVVCVGRSTGDAFFAMDTILGEGVDATDITVVIDSGLFTKAVITHGSSIAEVNGTSLQNLISHDTSSIQAVGCEVTAPIEARETSTVLAQGCAIFSTLEADAGALVDARSSEIFGGVAARIGVGPVDVSFMNLTVPVTAAATPVVISPPLSDANYVANPIEIGAGGNTTFGITAKTGSGFTLNGPAGLTVDIAIGKM